MTIKEELRFELLIIDMLEGKNIESGEELRRFSNRLHEMAIKILEQASCEDAISRQAVLDLIEHYNSDGLGSVFYGYDEGVKFAKEVNKLPSISPLEPKAGHWQKYKSMIYCSECGASIEAGYLNDMNYCHNCGSYNGGGKNEE